MISAFKQKILSSSYAKYRKALAGAAAISSKEIDNEFYPWLLSMLIPFSKKTGGFPALSFAAKKEILSLAKNVRIVHEYGKFQLTKKLKNKLVNINLGDGQESRIKNKSISLFILNKEIPLELFIEIAIYKICIGGHVVINNYDPLNHAQLLNNAMKHGYKSSFLTSIDIGKESFSMTCILERVDHQYSINNIEFELSNYLKFNNGFYIEAGANDGVNQSNTLSLSIHQGWRGLLVEADPDLIAQCSSNRPYDIIENYALVEPSRSGENIDFEHANLMSATRESFKTSEEFKKHIREGRSIQGNLKPKNFTTMGTTLNELLEKHSIKSVDLLSLDVEGYEAKVLEGINFSKVKPSFILVEARYPEDVFKILRPYYKLVKKISFHDYLFTSKSN